MKRLKVIALALMALVIAPTRELAIQVAEELNKNAPQAMRSAKKLVSDLKEKNFSEHQNLTAQSLARVRTSPEAKEGVAAFLEKRKPAW